MSRYQSKAYGVVCIFVLLACSNPNRPSDAEVAKSAQVIEQAIRLEVGKPDGPITDGDRLGLTELHISSTELVDLTPLGELRDLQGLSLRGCTRVSDLMPLENLPHLVYLDLTGCTAIMEIPESLHGNTKLNLIQP